jgi:hypothetical protein
MKSADHSTREEPSVKTDRLRSLAKQYLPESAQDLLVLLNRKQLAGRRWRFQFGDAPKEARPSPYAFPIAAGNELEALGEKHQPTKRLHNYLPYYWMHFRDIRNDVRNVLEIGIQTDKSIRMWEEFFPNATIHGLDIDPGCEQFEGDRRRMHVGDQSDREVLARVAAAADGPFDIVIDDGSHRVEHQLATFDCLFPLMSEHGIYVVEDTGGCVGDPENVTVNTLQTLVDSIQYWPAGTRPSDWPRVADFPEDASWADRNVIGVAFYRWIVFVMRGRNPQDNPHLRRPPKDAR